MKRRPEDDGERGGSADERLEAFFSGFLRRHPRLPIVLGVILVVVLIVAMLVVKFTGRSG